ncbi:hypothetical protein UlMin_039659 [Ulmus minor]
MKGLVQDLANYIALSPISFIERAAVVYGDQVSIIYGNLSFSWKQTYQRSLNLASAFVRLGISRHDVVAAFAPNIPPLYELHFAVPMAGGVLSALNTKLDETTLAVILEQLEAKLIFVDHQFVQVVLKAFQILTKTKISNLPIFVLIPETDHASSSSNLDQNLPPSGLNYNDLVEESSEYFEIMRPTNECDPISVNYTSGSTGIPKGAVYSHRAVYLNSLASILNFEMGKMPVFLWTVDMFRCNGWCFPWAMAALGGTNVCLRYVSAEIIFESIYLHKVTHLCGKPILLNTLAEGVETNLPLPSSLRPVEIFVAGALPASHIVTKVIELGFNVSHGYGMTEALGPSIVQPWRSEPCHKELRYSLTVEGFDVKDSNSMESVPNDGKTMGEIMFRGNTLMMGYLKNTKETQEAFKGGWYRTGDVAIRLSNGFIQMKDRAKDIVICGGQAISTIEVEGVLLSHPKVLEGAVVGRKDEVLGEIPLAFVKLKEEYCGRRSAFSCISKEILDFCGENLPAYMVPKDVVFGDLPYNSTGKVQKFLLRERANANNISKLDP